MKIAHKIALYSLCLLLSLTWVKASVSYIIKTASEKNIEDKKEALPEGKPDTDEKTFEIVYQFLPLYTIPFQSTIPSELNFNKIINLSQSVFLDLSNPPPEFHLLA